MKITDVSKTSYYIISLNNTNVIFPVMWKDKQMKNRKAPTRSQSGGTLDRFITENRRKESAPNNDLKWWNWVAWVKASIIVASEEVASLRLIMPDVFRPYCGTHQWHEVYRTIWNQVTSIFHLFIFSHHCNDLGLNGLWPVRSISNWKYWDGLVSWLMNGFNKNGPTIWIWIGIELG